MRSLAASLRVHLRRPGTKHTLLQVAGFGLISVALGMWLLPVGIAALGISALILSGLLE